MEAKIATSYITLKNEERPNLILELSDGSASELEITIHSFLILKSNNDYSLRVSQVASKNEEVMGTLTIDSNILADLGMDEFGATESKISIVLGKVYPKMHYGYKLELLDANKVVDTKETFIFFTGGNENGK